MKFNHNTDEKKLIAACLKADPKAQRQLYEQFAPGMMAVCFRYTGNYEVAQDLLQDGFVKVLQNWILLKVKVHSEAG